MMTMTMIMINIVTTTMILMMMSHFCIFIWTVVDRNMMVCLQRGVDKQVHCLSQYF